MGDDWTPSGNVRASDEDVRADPEYDNALAAFQAKKVGLWVAHCRELRKRHAHWTASEVRRLIVADAAEPIDAGT